MLIAVYKKPGQEEAYSFLTKKSISNITVIEFKAIKLFVRFRCERKGWVRLLKPLQLIKALILHHV